MREIRTYGSEGGGLQEMALPLPLSWVVAHRSSAFRKTAFESDRLTRLLVRVSSFA